MAKYQKYAEYKHSGIEWLGEIPSHWITTQVKYGYKVTLGKMLQTAPKTFLDELKPYLKAQNIQPNGISLNQVEEMWFSPDECKKLLLIKGDVLVSEGGDIGRSAIWNGEIEECYIQNAINRVRPKVHNQSKFFLYWMYFLKSTDFINIICNKATIAHYTAEKLEASPLVLPSSDEQTQIANFLDYETAQIDTLIAKQEKLIELLKEKRQAVISHAVTKGLNPDVNMKDSGVEWLGQVPEHWKVMQFRRITSLSQGLQIPQSERLHEPNDNTVEYITIKSLNAKDDAYKEYIYKASDRVTCGKSDVLLARTGATGEVVTNVSGAFHNNFFKVSYSNDILRDFLVYILKVKELKSHLLMLAGTTTIPDLNHGAFLGTQIALPSLTEQQEIIDFIDDYLRRSMILEGKARLAIQLMQERRTALISSAVTGKINVSNWRHPNEAKTEFGA
ncbi:restriction endonuclease subunit S [Acinetobacter towneri]|uniref:restriction endonuclease subunit S n=1 Tax=Acinetobacter towneri TaxID=202956 RepID=UPI00321581DA